MKVAYSRIQHSFTFFFLILHTIQMQLFFCISIKWQTYEFYWIWSFLFLFGDDKMKNPIFFLSIFLSLSIYIYYSSSQTTRFDSLRLSFSSTNLISFSFFFFDTKMRICLLCTSRHTKSNSSCAHYEKWR